MPVKNHQNPGTTNPADQAYPAVESPAAAPKPRSALTKDSSGEMQLPSIGPAWAAPCEVKGLAANVNVADASQVRAQPPVTAETRPPARDAHPGSGRPGGLPANVNIR